MIIKCLFLAAFIGFVYAQASEPILPENFSLPPELQGKVDEKSIQGIQNKSQEEFKKKCEQYGGPNAFANATSAFGDFTKCLQTLVDLTVLQEEIEAAKPNGAVDEVFKKYCLKKPQFKGCFTGLTAASKPCFSVEERKNLKTVHNVSEQLAEFICFKDGDRLALFISEGGKECFEESQPDLETCLNKTIGGDININMDNFTSDNMPSLTFDEEQCNKISELQVCVVGILNKCPKPTTANIVDSLFKFIRKATPCKAFKGKEDAQTRSQGTDPTEKSVPDAAHGLTVTSATIMMGLFTSLLMM